MIPFHIKYVKYHQDEGDASKGFTNADTCIRNKKKTGAYSHQLIIQFPQNNSNVKLQLKAEVFAALLNAYTRKNIRRTFH